MLVIGITYRGSYNFIYFGQAIGFAMWSDSALAKLQALFLMHNHLINPVSQQRLKGFWIHLYSGFYRCKQLCRSIINSQLTSIKALGRPHLCGEGTFERFCFGENKSCGFHVERVKCLI